MPINVLDPEYAMPGELTRRAPAYDLRTGPELATIRMDNHQARIVALESRLRHVEVLLHRAINTLHDEHGRRICTDDYGDAIEATDGV